MGKRKAVTPNSSNGRFVIGRESFSKISAVEGLKMPKSMRGDFKTLDKQGASSRVRRDTLSGKYGK
ncbi:MAG TPA: hypothetical protein VH000_02930 [Rhizomicrobium sp.]|jgi:hypothetical protein|nr:hypothetical protein [Rhizomicrobium sp.]